MTVFIHTAIKTVLGAASLMAASLATASVATASVATAIMVVAIMMAAGASGRGASVVAAELGNFEAAVASIRATDAKAHIDTLADDAFEGREAGSRGGRAAGGYLAKYLADRQLQGAGDPNSYFQVFGDGHRNLLAMWPGSDPKLREEVVLLGAHYDHVGYGNRMNSRGPIGAVHNGADDNASGTSAILELIDAFRMLAAPPKRSVLFALWDGEEKGLLGSSHWVRTPTVPLERVKFAFNLDMVGRLRGERLEVIGSRTAVGFRQSISRLNLAENLLLDFTWELKANSDHHPFFARGIPVIMFHTGLHDDYHRPSDDIEGIVPDGVERVTRLAFRLACDMADGPGLPSFRPQSRSESPVEKKALEQAIPIGPPRFGAGWKWSEGAVITLIKENSPAAKMGLRVGDRILQYNQRPVDNENRLGVAILTAADQLELTVLRTGKTEPETLAVTLDGKPMRVGVIWGDDPAEPGTIFLRQVVPLSPAGLAGLKVGDRVLEVSGRRFATSQEFGTLLNTLPGPLEMVIERQGRISTIRVPLADELLAPTAVPGDAGAAAPSGAAAPIGAAAPANAAAPATVPVPAPAGVQKPAE